MSEASKPIINIDEKNHALSTLKGVLGTRISITNLKTKFDKKLMKFVIPIAGSLSKPIKGSPKETDILRVIRVNKSFRLLHVENFSNVTMQERRLNVNLNYFEVICGCDSHDQANSFKLNNW